MVLQGDRAKRGEGAPWRTEKGEISGEKGKVPLIQPLENQTGQDRVLIASPVVAVVSRFVDLGLLLNGGILTALHRATLSILLQVVVEHL